MCKVRVENTMNKKICWVGLEHRGGWVSGNIPDEAGALEEAAEEP